MIAPVPVHCFSITFTTKGTQLFEINAYHLHVLIMPININVDCTSIIKTDLQNRVLQSNLMLFERFSECFDNRCLK